MILFFVLYVVACYSFMRGVRVRLLAEGKDLTVWARAFAPFFVWHLAGESMITAQKYHHIVLSRIDEKDCKKKNAEANAMAIATEKIRQEIERNLKAANVGQTEPPKNTGARIYGVGKPGPWNDY